MENSAAGIAAKYQSGYDALMLQRIIIACIRRYQRTPTALHARCRFEPTCSEYMALAVAQYGALRGLWKGCKRLARCRPPHGGIDNP